jgi:hypothetical protein
MQRIQDEREERNNDYSANEKLFFIWVMALYI